jgi:class 3 adenylate cyclase
MYRERFENLFRVANKITSSLNIGDILEIIRDEAKISIPRTSEACLLLLDPDAAHYTRPLHCTVYDDRLNCQLCKRGRETIQKALSKKSDIQCAFYEGLNKCRNCRLGLSTREGDDGSLTPCLSSQSADSETRPEDERSALCDIAMPIYDGEKPVAVLELIAEEGRCYNERDAVILKDLTKLAANVLTNVRKHWKMSQEKLNMDQILTHLRPFVPETVQRIVEKDPSAPSLEKRDVDVSILFLDIAGYTKISESLTQEKVNFIIEKYFSSFFDVIYAHDGDVNETAGDGLMVIFQGGVKEHAVNAAKGALDVRRRTLEINEELKGRFDPVHVNMGINSGVASVGMTRFHGASGTRMTYTASGSVTNLAARIGAAATNGDILVGPETARRIQDEIPLHDRGLMRFKNVKEEARVFSLIRSMRHRSKGEK